MGAPAGFAAGALGLAGMVLLGAPLALLWVAAGAGAISAGAAVYAHRQGTRRFREASRAQRERAERARRAQIRRERDRTLNRQARERAQAARPVVAADSRIVTPSGCTPPCYGSRKPHSDECTCPCGGRHHGEGARLRAERRKVRSSKGK